MRAIDLGGSTLDQSRVGVGVAREEGGCGARVAAQIEVDVCAAGVGRTQTGLRAQRVAIGGAEVVDLDHDGRAGV